jgi:hypothetical protein
MSRTPLSLAGFQVIISGRFWVIAEDLQIGTGAGSGNTMPKDLQTQLRLA